MTTTPPPGRLSAPHQPALQDAWTASDASALYGFEGWGGGYFRVGASGHVVVTPRGHRDPSASIDLHDVVEGLSERGLHTPVLIRFTDVLESRMRDLKDAFEALLKQLFAIPAQIVQKIGAVVSPGKPTRARGGASKAKAKSAANGASKDKGRCGAKCGGRPAVAKRM